MNQIYGFWIIKEDGNVIFSHEYYIQGIDNIEDSLFSGFILSILQFSSVFGGKEIERIELGGSKVFIIKDKDTHLIFALKSNLEANNKKMIKTIKSIYNEFNKMFGKEIENYSNEDLKKSFKNIYIKEIDQKRKKSLDKKISEFLNKI